MSEAVASYRSDCGRYSYRGSTFDLTAHVMNMCIIMKASKASWSRLPNKDVPHVLILEAKQPIHTYRSVYLFNLWRVVDLFKYLDFYLASDAYLYSSR